VWVTEDDAKDGLEKQLVEIEIVAAPLAKI